MRFLWTGLRKDTRSVRRDPFGLLIPIGIPLTLAILMNLVFGSHGNSVPHGRLLVDDQDRSFASGMLIVAFGRAPLNQMIAVQRTSAQEGHAGLNRGEASALLIVPAGFQQAFLSDAPCRLQLFTNPAERILPRMIEETIDTMLETAVYMRHSAAPPPVHIETGVAHAGSGVNFAALFFPSMIFFSLMMVANSLASEVWKERMAGTLRRLASTPVSLTWYVGGRLLFANLVLLAIGLVAVPSMHSMAGVPVQNMPAAVLWMMLSGSALYLALLFLVMHAESARSANILGNMVIFPLSMLGGCFFPFEAMPQWMAAIGRFTPNGWAITQFKAILAGQVHAGALAASAAGLLAVSAIGFWLAVRRLRGGFVL